MEARGARIRRGWRHAVHRVPRTVLTGAMVTYRVEGDMVVITKHLLDRDVFETGEMAAHARSRGWAMWAGAGTCAGCRQPVMPPKQRLGVGNGACATTATGASPGGAKSKGMVNGEGCSVGDSRR